MVPSICNVLGHPGFWLDKPELAIDWMKVLHAEQSFKTHRLATPLAEQLALERAAIVESVLDPDFAEGVRAALEKRVAAFSSAAHNAVWTGLREI